MFFAKITNSTNPKNQLQDYLSKQVKSLDCITVEEPEAFKKYLETMVHRANLKFPRCRSLTSYLHPSHGSGNGFAAGISELVQINLYHQEGTFETLQAQPMVLKNEGVQAAMFA